MKVYILFYDNGEHYEDYSEDIVGVFNNAEEVNKYLEKNPAEGGHLPNRCEVWEGTKRLKLYELTTRIKEE